MDVYLSVPMYVDTHTHQFVHDSSASLENIESTLAIFFFCFCRILEYMGHIYNTHHVVHNSSSALVGIVGFV